MPKTNPLSEALRAGAKTPPPPPRPPPARAGRDGMRLVGAHFAAPVHRQLRRLAAQEDCTIQSLLAEALNELFAKRKLPPIA